ncbi:MAG: hypothetical protein SangKO_067700 [Sandaracinaceae bacterium]
MHVRLLCFAVMALLAAVVLGPTAAHAQGPTRPPTVEAVLADYELIRAALARDDGEGVAEPARRIVRHVEGGLASTAPAYRARLAQASSEARRLSGLDPADLVELRHAFGELSRALVALLQEQPTLTEGLHVFECPMTSGYGRWVQRTRTTSNPFMGGRMPMCGRRVN